MKKYITDINGNPRLIDITEADIQKEKELLDKQKSELRKINREKEIDNIKLISVDGIEFDADKKSRIAIRDKVIAMNENQTTQWKIADNSFVSVTREQLKEVLNIAEEMITEIVVKYG